MAVRFERFEITDAGELLRDGVAVHLQPQPMKVLTLLASRAGELVPREEIQRCVWSDGTHVDFDQGLNWCIRRIREVLGDDAAAPRFVQTVPRRGYRFIAAAGRRPASRRGRRRSAVAAMVLALFVGIRGARAPVSVVVLPFDDLGDARVASEIATSEVMHSLAAIDPERLSVIDPLTAAKFKKTGECIITIGQALDTEYVLLGAVRRTGERLRVTAQLFRVADNRQAWAAERSLALDADPAAAYARLSREAAATISSKFNRSSID
jgi:DNA-binding winged helix-turn-helix (wHTH) protein/TolB-like protein